MEAKATLDAAVLVGLETAKKVGDTRLKKIGRELALKCPEKKNYKKIKGIAMRDHVAGKWFP